MIEEEKLEAPRLTNTTFNSGNRLWRYGPLIAWAILIFIGSSDLLSSSHTSNFLVRPLHWMFPAASNRTLASFHFVIRKLAHFTEYAIMALLAARAFQTSSREFLRTRWLVLSLVVVVVYALSDEFHQSFYPTRTASIYDSLIDSLGGLAALTFLWWRERRNVSRAGDAA